MSSQRQRWIALTALAALVLLTSTALAGEATKYGEGVELEEAVKISQVYAHPEKYLDKTIRVEGRIIDVCHRRGHWMELASDEEFQSLRIEVEHGVIVFPADCKGKYGITEGVVEKVDLTLEQTRHIAHHKANERGEGDTFDEESITEPMTMYIMHATGAVIEDRPAEKSKEGECKDHEHETAKAEEAR
jgi:hypothetical protein